VKSSLWILTATNFSSFDESAQLTLTELMTRKLQAGNLVDLLPLSVRGGGDPIQEQLVSVLDAIEKQISSNEPIDALNESLEVMVEEEPLLRDAVLSWLSEKKRHPRAVWYFLEILRPHSVRGLDSFALELLR